MESITYEKIGSGLYQRLKRVTEQARQQTGPPSPPNDHRPRPHDMAKERDLLEKFIPLYQEAPLFLVGFGQEDINDFEDLPEYGKGFHMPFPTVLLEYPMTARRIRSTAVPGMSYKPIVYVTTVHDGLYYAEVLSRTDEIDNDEYIREVSQATDIPYEQIKAAISKHETGTARSFAIHVNRDTGAIRVEHNAGTVIDCQRKASHRYESITKTMEWEDCHGCNDRTQYCKEEMEASGHWALLIAKTISYISQPDVYIVMESRPLTPREAALKAKGKMPFFAKKSRHIVLDHSQIREILPRTAGGGTHKSPVPHLRIAHWRTLRHIRYKEKKSIRVKKAQINKGKAWELDKRIYEIVVPPAQMN